MTTSIELSTEKSLIAGMDELLFDMEQPLSSLEQYWAQSASASVMSDYEEGRSVVVKC